MAVPFGTTRAASFGSTWGMGWRFELDPPGLPRCPIVADAPRRSRSYVLASLRALHLDLQLVVDIGQQSRKAEFKAPSSHLIRGGAISSPHRTCPIRGGAT
jgi:hypothetical protein